MAHATTPHTQTQQNRTPNQSDLDPDQLEQTAGAEADLYDRREGAQSGTNRGPQAIPASPGQPNTEQPAAAYEGSVTSRTPGGAQQGISSHSADEEKPGQQKVVKDRPVAQAGTNHSR